MAKVKIINRDMRTSDIDDMIRFQLMCYMYVSDKRYNDCEMRCLILLAKNDNVKQSDFCNMCVESGIYQSGQSARNFIVKAVNQNTIIRDDKKRLKISDDAYLRSDSSAIFNIRFVYVKKEA